MKRRSTRRLLTSIASLAAAGFALAGCNVDGTVSLEVRPDGSGEISVTLTADSAVTAAAPELAGDLRTADLVEAGWEVQGPEPTDTGGLTVVLRRGFDTPSEATAVLAGLNGDKGPLRAVSIARASVSRDSRSRKNRLSTALTRPLARPSSRSAAQAETA